MALTPLDKTRAEHIVDRWFWQLDESRQYRYKNATKRIVRFYESAPLSADVFKIVLEHLSSMDGVETLSLNHKQVRLEGKWNALGAWYTSAPAEKWAGTESTKVRIYQALVQAGAGDEADLYVVENGCKQKVSHEFHWDVEAKPTLPSSTSGVQYSIQGLSRDRETGLYSYVIERRETVQQDLPSYTTEDTLFESRAEEAHIGVNDTKVESTGLKASAAKGVITRRKVRKNPDCTSDVENETVTEKSVVDAITTARKTLRGTIKSVTNRNQSERLQMTGLKLGEMRRSEKTPGGLYQNTNESVTVEAAGVIAKEERKTLFETTSETLTNQLTEPAENVPEAANGVTVTRSVKKTEEGSVDVAVRTVTEKAVKSAVVVKRRNLRGVAVSTTDRGEASAPTDELKLGEVLRVEKTEGGRHLIVKESFEPNTGNTEIASEVTKSAFRTITEKLVNLPSAEESKPYEDSEEKGVVVQRATRKFDDGTMDITERITKEKSVPKSHRTARTDAFRTVITFRDTATEEHTQNVPNTFPTQPIPESESRANPNANGENVAPREVSIEKTEGGMATINKVFCFPAKKEWDTPEIQTNFRYRKSWYFRNCTKKEAEEKFTEAQNKLKEKLSEWFSSHRPPTGHDLEPVLTMNEDGLYDGQATIRANWSEDSAGLDGATDFIIASFEWDYWAFNARGDRATKTNYAGCSEFLGYNGVKVRKRRIVGCGENLLNRILAVGASHPFCGQEPQFSYNSTTHVWTIEIATGIFPMYTNGEVATLIKPDQIDPGSSSAPDIPIKAILDSATKASERISNSAATSY